MVGRCERTDRSTNTSRFGSSGLRTQPFALSRPSIWSRTSASTFAPIVNRCRHLQSVGSRCQLFEGYALADHAPEQGIQSFLRVSLHVALAQSERELVDVGSAMLDRPVVIRPVEPTLENRPDAFNRIRVRHVVDEFLCGVIDSLVVVESPEAIVASMLVSVSEWSRIDGFMDGMDFLLWLRTVDKTIAFRLRPRWRIPRTRSFYQPSRPAAALALMLVGFLASLRVCSFRASPL